MRFAMLLASALLSACSLFVGVLAGNGADFCRTGLADYPRNRDQDVDSELAKEPPNGALTQPFSTELWVKHWNHVIYYGWDIGPNSCSGTYRGPTGPEMLKVALQKRKVYGLPDIPLEERNRGKAVY